MGTSRSYAGWQGVLAGSVTLGVVVLPTVAIIYGAQAGSIGSVSFGWFGPIAGVVIAAIAILAGDLVRRAYRTDPTRRPGDVWSTWFSGFTVLVIGSWFVPFIVLFVFIDSDHALSDRMLAVMTVWTLGHLVVAGLAGWVMRSLRR